MTYNIQAHHVKQPLPYPTKNKPSGDSKNVSFQSMLADSLEQSSTLKMSKHAKKRIQERAINISDREWGKIEEKISEAKEKGIQESLVVTKDAALVVSAHNRTVITAMDRQEAGSQIFTGINGTVLIDE
ncbi:TIGR02530 family flagellar biosynthesis protein [Alteribacter populi]|uniref:TIGR02530 family flagellar biosynthesis protein n=1 Tax=Alteribacter populi TaxID=2011011 RepID=UPI001E61A329|nr:TIGR02530 family flagellar biosynthesis protein [Alteribacter populi]